MAKMMKNIWVAQPAKEMGWLRPVRLQSILGIMMSVYMVSEADSMLRKKYMGDVEVMIKADDGHNDDTACQS